LRVFDGNDYLGNKNVNFSRSTAALHYTMFIQIDILFVLAKHYRLFVSYVNTERVD
jgi:hypothetical protein